MRVPSCNMRSLASVSTLLVMYMSDVRAVPTATNSTVSYCSDTKTVVLANCGDKTCGADQPCVQYPSASTTTCSTASRNECEAYDATCTYQCLEAYNTISAKWTLFVKEPKATDTADAGVANPTDKFPSAPIERVASGIFSDETLAMYVYPSVCRRSGEMTDWFVAMLFCSQITGFDSTDVQKGSVKKVAFDDSAFADVEVLKTLYVLFTTHLGTTVCVVC